MLYNNYLHGYGLEYELNIYFNCGLKNEDVSDHHNSWFSLSRHQAKVKNLREKNVSLSLAVKNEFSSLKYS